METARQLIDEAIDLGGAGQYAQAHERLTQAIAFDPAQPQAYFERALALMNLDRDQEALADFERCLELHPDFPGAHDWHAKALASTGRLRRAAEKRLKSLRQHPAGKYEGMGVSPQEWADCAEGFAKCGDAKTAVALLEEYLAQHAQHVTSYACYATAPLRLLARLLLGAGETARAEELARAAYSNAHRVPMDYVVYALSLEACGKKGEALRIADEALAQNDQLAEALALRRRLLPG